MYLGIWLLFLMLDKLLRRRSVGILNFVATSSGVGQNWDLLYTFSIMSKTYQPKKRKRSKTHGFRKRQKSAGGRKTLVRRRRKGRVRLSV